jgi:hypothetical protein
MQTSRGVAMIFVSPRKSEGLPRLNRLSLAPLRPPRAGGASGVVLMRYQVLTSAASPWRIVLIALAPCTASGCFVSSTPAANDSSGTPAGGGTSANAGGAAKDSGGAPPSGERDSGPAAAIDSGASSAAGGLTTPPLTTFRARKSSTRTAKRTCSAASIGHRSSGRARATSSRRTIRRWPKFGKRTSCASR